MNVYVFIGILALAITISITMANWMMKMEDKDVDREPYIPDTDEPLVKIHYAWELGTDIAIVPISEIRDYTSRFRVLSIKEYKKKKNNQNE